MSASPPVCPPRMSLRPPVAPPGMAKAWQGCDRVRFIERQVPLSQLAGCAGQVGCSAERGKPRRTGQVGDGACVTATNVREPAGLPACKANCRPGEAAGPGMSMRRLGGGTACRHKQQPCPLGTLATCCRSWRGASSSPVMSLMPPVVPPRTSARLPVSPPMMSRNPPVSPPISAPTLLPPPAAVLPNLPPPAPPVWRVQRSVGGSMTGLAMIGWEPSNVQQLRHSTAAGGPVTRLRPLRHLRRHSRRLW